MNYFDILKAAKVGGNLPSYYETLFARKLPCSKYAWQETTLTGIPPITFAAKGTPLTAYSITGSMQQTGTPTPTEPIVPEECGDKTANLWDEEYTSISSEIMYRPIYVGEGYFTMSTTCSQTQSSTATLFFLSGNVSSGASTSSTGVWEGRSLTKQSVDGYVTVAYRRYVGDNASDPLKNHTMLNTGGTALPYEPYGFKIPVTVGGNTYTVYLSEPLRKIGDYADVVDSSGTVTRRVKKLVLDASWNWQQASNGCFYVTNLISDYMRGQDAIYFVCSHFIGAIETGGTSSVPDNAVTAYAVQSSYSALYCGYRALPTVDDFKQFLTDNTVTVWYARATATTESTTCPTITPASGSNTLSVGTSLQPSEVSITGKIKEA